MSKALRERINQFNKIKYKKNKEKRIIFCTLKPRAMTVASNIKE